MEKSNRYTKRPMTIEAIQWTGTNYDSIATFVGYKPKREHDKLWIMVTGEPMVCEKGDFVIKGVEKEIYPCAKSVFDKTYDHEEDAPLSGALAFRAVLGLIDGYAEKASFDLNWRIRKNKKQVFDEMVERLNTIYGAQRRKIEESEMKIDDLQIELEERK